MIVVDTCAIVWDALDATKLTPKAKKAIDRHASELIICDISIWEIAMLIRRKRLVVDFSASGFISLLLQSRNFHIQDITPEIAEMSVNFGSQISNDAADKMIAATSVLRNAPVVTADRNLRDAPMVETIW